MSADLVQRLLVAIDAQPPYALLAVVEQHLRAAVDADWARLWLADYAEASLTRLRLDGDDGEDTQAVEGTATGAVFRTQRPSADAAAGGTVTLRVPVSVRSERLGVLEVGLSVEPAPQLSDTLAAAGLVLGYVVQAARRYTDLYELARRGQTLELPAELQWELLPVLAHTDPEVAIAGSLEPAYDIGGDNFDYAVSEEGVWVAITDAMGHGTTAALLSTLAVAALRNARRRGLGLRQQVRGVNTAVHDQFFGEVFSTGLFLRVDRVRGRMEAVNAGHSLILLVRDGVVRPLVFPPDLPVGLFPDTDFVAHEFPLRPGDRLVLYSDGVLEATDAGGVPFGDERLGAHLLATDGSPPVEVVRRLTAGVTAHQDGFLNDDATAVCLDYRRDRSRRGR